MFYNSCKFTINLSHLDKYLHFLTLPLILALPALRNPLVHEKRWSPTILAQTPYRYLISSITCCQWLENLQELLRNILTLARQRNKLAKATQAQGLSLIFFPVFVVKLLCRLLIVVIINCISHINFNLLSLWMILHKNIYKSRKKIWKIRNI